MSDRTFEAKKDQPKFDIRTLVIYQYQMLPKVPKFHNFYDVKCECYLVALELHVQQLEMVAVHGHLLRAADLVVHGVEAPEAVAAAGLIPLVVAKLHKVVEQDFTPEIEPI